jgi:UrcA family protein
MSRVFSLLGAFALGFGLALPAVAEPRPVAVETVSVTRPQNADELRSQTVRFSDLDLRSGAGATIAVTRISIAARTVCDEYADSTRNLRAHAVSKRCRHDAMDSAVTRLDAPRVSEAYFGQRLRQASIASAARAAASWK